MAPKKFKRVVIDYPPVTTRKWRTPKKDRAHVPQPFNRKPISRIPEYPKFHRSKVSTLQKIWHSYRMVKDNYRAILTGNYSQNDIKFPFDDRGKQGPANCFIAIGYSKILDMAKWSSKSLDKILEFGEQLYRTSIAINKLSCNCTLPKEVHNTFYIDRYLVVLAADPLVLKGVVDPDSDQPGLRNKLRKAFRSCNYIILEMNTKYLAIWKSRGAYYVFDPNDRNSDGNRVRESYGTAVVIKFTSFTQLVDDCLRNYGFKVHDDEIAGFTLTPIHIKKIEERNFDPPSVLDFTKESKYEKMIDSCLMTKFPRIPDPKEVTGIPPAPPLPGPPEKSKKKSPPKPKPKPPELTEPERESNTPSFNAVYEEGRIEEVQTVIPPEKVKQPTVSYYRECVPGKLGIIRASYNQNDPGFSRHGGKQSLCNGVAAIAMLTLNKAKFWFPKILDDILITGELIYRQSIRQMSGDQILDFKTMLKKFKLSRFYFTPVITDISIIGKLNSATPSVLDLLPALEEFFTDNDAGIIRGPLTLAVWFEEDRYYMFDPNDRNCYGLAILKGYQIGDNNQEVAAITEQGYACVTWFMNLADLVALYFNNLERHKRRDHFIISRVEIKDYVELPDPWGNFVPVTPTKWILRGTFSQNNTRFSGFSRNTQCTAIATLACAYIKLKNMPTWDRSTVDYLLIEGDLYYNQCIASLKERNKFAQKMLMMCELLDNYNIEDKEVIINIEECLINGVVHAPDNFEFPNLRKGIEEFFVDNNQGVITAKNISIGIWKYEDSYFYFDSHSRGPEGYDDYSGTACIMRLSSVPELALQINSNFGIGKDEVYNIASVEAIFRERLPDGTVKPDFKEYTKLNEKKGILRSNFYQGDVEKFDVDADKQTWPNIMMSLAISKLMPSNLWNKSTIDEIITQGQELYTACKTDNYKEDLLKAATWESRLVNPSLDVINHENVLKEFKVGVHNVTIEIGVPLEGIFEIDLHMEEDIEIGMPLSVILYKALDEAGDPLVDPPPRREFILSSDHLMLGLWKDLGLYYCFDPTGKDPEGNFFGRELWSAKIILADEGDYDAFQEDFIDGEPPASNLTSKTKTALETSEIVPYSDDWDEDENVEELLSKLNEYHIDTSNHKACVLMFASFEDLCSHIVENVPPNKRSEAVKLFPTKTVTKPILKETTNPLNRVLGNWYNFMEIDKERWILRGTINMHSKIFPEVNRGKQYSSMCVAGIAYGRLYALPKYTSTTIDHIIKYGDKLHTAIRKLREKELRANSVELGLSGEEIEELVGCLEIRPSEVLKQFYMGNFLVLCSVNEAILEGDVKKDWLPKPKIDLKALEAAAAEADAGKGRKRGGRERGGRARGGRDKKGSSKRAKGGKSEPEPTAPTYLSIEEQAAGILGITEGITNFFKEKQYGILNARGKSVSFWKLFDFFYLFDPEARSPIGTQEHNGNSCIMRFAQLPHLIETIDKNLDKDGENNFTIDEVIIRSKEGKRPDPEVTKVILKDPKITAYNEIADGKMILRGNFHQDHAKFAVPKSACGSANAIVSVAMANIHKAATWTKLIIDEVLTNAYRLYKHSVSVLGCNFNSWDDKLVLELMCPEFKIGIKFVTFKPILEGIKTGVLNIKSTTILNLRRGLEDFFLDYNYGVIESDYLQCGVWLENELYYLFDPNERGPTGLFTTGGRAALIIFKNLSMLAGHFLLNIPEEFHSWEYKITPVELMIKEMKPPAKPLKKCEILKHAENDSLASAKPKPPKPKPPKSTVEISCEKNKSNTAFKGKPMCVCPDKGLITVKKKDKVNLLELTPEEKKEWARQKSEEKKYKLQLHMENCMRKAFYVLENGDGIVRAKYSQNSPRFSPFTRDKQSIPNALVSLVMLRIHDPNTWSHANIEIVLDSGDLLYKDSFQLYRPTNPKLGLRNVLRKFYVLNLRFETVIYKPCLAGYCNYDEVFRSLLNFFMQDNAAILLGDSLVVSVYQKCCQYFMFDPHDRNMHGNLSCACHGAACLMRFESLEHLVAKYIENVPTPVDKFIICAVKVEGVTPASK